MSHANESSPRRPSLLAKRLGVIAAAALLVLVGVAAGVQWGGQDPDRPSLVQMPASVALELLHECESAEDVYSLVAGQMVQAYDHIDFIRAAYHQVPGNDSADPLIGALEAISDYAAEQSKSVGQ